MSNSTQGASPNSPLNAEQPDNHPAISMQAVKAARRAFHEWKGKEGVQNEDRLFHAIKAYEAARPKREVVNIRALAARLSDAATAVITFTDWANDGDGVTGRQAAHRQYIAALKEWQEVNAALQAALTTQIEDGKSE